MAERIKDNEDLALEALFRSEPLADDGFSARVVGRIRRRIWVRRLALPTACFVGLLIAARPAVDLVIAFAGVVRALPLDSIGVSIDWVPRTSALVIAAAAIAVVLLLPALED